MNNNEDNQIPQTGFKGLSLIVATDQENGIGKNNQLLWHLPNDLKFFKKTTSGHTIIMGRKTFDSIGKALPNRRNIVITRQKDLAIENVEVFNSLEQAIATCNNEDQYFVIGGGEIYKQALPLANNLYLTKVKHTFNADTFFPNIPALEWQVVFKEVHQKDEKHQYDYSFLILRKH